MKYLVKVKAGSSQNKVVEENGGLVVYTHARAHDGEANKAVTAALAEHFGVAKGSVRIAVGAASRNKIIEIK